MGLNRTEMYPTMLEDTHSKHYDDRQSLPSVIANPISGPAPPGAVLNDVIPPIVRRVPQVCTVCGGAVSYSEHRGATGWQHVNRTDHAPSLSPYAENLDVSYGPIFQNAKFSGNFAYPLHGHFVMNPLTGAVGADKLPRYGIRGY